jgi:hypothetical protein
MTLLVKSQGHSMIPLPVLGPRTQHAPVKGGTYIFPQIFPPFEQNATFLPAYTLPYTYTIR